jgi:hypothetical protein
LCRNCPSFPIVYTTGGTLVAASYTATCSECKCIIHHSSWTPKSEEKEEYFFGPFQSRYVQVTSQTVFEIKLLDQVTFQVAFSGATFESQALVYNATNGEFDETRLSVFAQPFGRVQNPQSYAWKLNQK